MTHNMAEEGRNRAVMIYPRENCSETVQKVHRWHKNHKTNRTNCNRRFKYIKLTQYYHVPMTKLELHTDTTLHHNCSGTKTCVCGKVNIITSTLKQYKSPSLAPTSSLPPSPSPCLSLPLSLHLCLCLRLRLPPSFSPSLLLSHHSFSPSLLLSHHKLTPISQVGVEEGVMDS